MKKTYENPMLQVVSIKRNDIITGSNPGLTGTYEGGDVLAPDRNVFGERDIYLGY